MGDVKPLDPLVSTEEEVEVDAQTAAALELGIKAADEGRVVSSDEVRKIIPRWFMPAAQKILLTRSHNTAC